MACGGGLRVVEVAEHHVGAAEQHLALVPAGRCRRSGSAIAARAGDGRPQVVATVVGSSPGRHIVATTPRSAVRGEHGVEAELASASARPARPARSPRRSPRAAATTGRCVGESGWSSSLSEDRRRAGQHGDPLRARSAAASRVDVEHRLRARSSRRCSRHDEDAGLVAEAVEERVDHQVAVGGGQPRRLAPRPRPRARVCRCALIAPLLRPVVPEVNRMSATSSGVTASARRLDRGDVGRRPPASASRARCPRRSMTGASGERPREESASWVAPRKPSATTSARRVGAAMTSATSWAGVAGVDRHQRAAGVGRARARPPPSRCVFGAQSDHPVARLHALARSDGSRDACGPGRAARRSSAVRAVHGRTAVRVAERLGGRVARAAGTVVAHRHSSTTKASAW